MKRSLLAVIVIILSLITSVMPVSAAPIIHEFWNTGGDANSADIYGAIIVAQQFTSEATSHTVTAIAVEMLRVGTPSNVEIELWNAAAGEPTTKIGGTSILGTALSTSYTKYIVAFPTYSLLPSTQYAVVVSVPSGDNANYVRWHQDSGGGLAAAIGSDSTDSGINWTVDAGGADYLFEIYGDVVFEVPGAHVFSDYLVSGDWLITVDAINSYPGYADVSDPERYFNVQVLNVAGTAVLAATTLKSWGEAPVGIYLSPTTVSALTYNSAYIIRMIGTFAGTPSTNYVLTGTDWVGSDLRYLDQWCLTTAKKMNTYDGNTSTQPYTTNISGTGEVLTTYGGGFFTTGIPSIMQIRPDLFQSSTTTPSYETGTATNVYDNEVAWTVQVGTTIAADATIWGTLFGVTAKQYMALGIWAAFIFAMLFTFTSRQGAETVFVMVLSAPILLTGVYFRIIDIQVVLVMAAIAVLLFVLKMWFTK